MNKIVVTLTINIGNDAMLSDHDVANALEGVAQRFRDARYVQTVAEEGERQGYNVDRPVFDGLGNTVGEFHVLHQKEEDVVGCTGCGSAAVTSERHGEPVCSSCAKVSD